MADSRPSPSSASLVSRLTSATIADRTKLKSFLSGMKVPDLRQEFKERGRSYTGLTTKAQLVARLLDELSPERLSPSKPQPDSSRKSPVSSTSGTPPRVQDGGQSVQCLCGVKDNDNEPMVKCTVCGQWSQIACYGLTPSQAKKARFKCNPCSSKPTHDHLFSSITSQVNDLHHKVSVLSSQLNSHINSQLLAKHGDNLQSSISKINTSISKIFDKLNYLDQVVESPPRPLVAAPPHAPQEGRSSLPLRGQPPRGHKRLPPSGGANKPGSSYAMFRNHAREIAPPNEKPGPSLALQIISRTRAIGVKRSPPYAQPISLTLAACVA